jgi:hypothetical protein
MERMEEAEEAEEDPEGVLFLVFMINLRINGRALGHGYWRFHGNHGKPAMDEVGMKIPLQTRRHVRVKWRKIDKCAMPDIRE